MRLSQYLAKNYNISRREAKEEISNGKVILNSQICVKDKEISDLDKVDYNKNISIKDDSILNTNIINHDETSNFKKYVIYKDNDYLFLYKPYFMHSDRHRQNDPLTISDIINYYKTYVSLTRLDYETDGIIGAVSSLLYEKIKNKNLPVSKKYLAITYGIFPKHIEISNKIDAKKTQKVKVIENDDSGNLTSINLLKSKVIKIFNEEIQISLIEVELNIAARHQIRAYTSFLKHPILFDPFYGDSEKDNMLLEHIKNKDIPKRLMLHCKEYNINNKSINCTDYTLKFIDYFNNI